MKKIKLLSVLFLMLLISCQNKIDSSSDAAFKSSINKIGESMSDDEKTEFFNAVKVISFNEMFEGRMDLKKVMEIGSEKEKLKDLQSKFNGMTAVDVIKEANGIKEERQNKEQVTN